jgi:large repetitive protein
VGTTTVTYRLTDPSNNVVTCSFEVTVVDDQAPVIDGVVCNAAINTVVDAGLCTDNQTFDLSSSTDNCGVTGYEAVILNANGQFTNYNTASFDHDFGVGVSVVTFTISDAAGNTSSCSLSVVVTDEQEPTVTCPANMDLVITNSDPDACGLVSDFTLPHPQDNCGISQFVYSIFLPDGSVAGPFDLTFVYSDPGLFGNSTTLSYFFPVGTSTINILGEDFNGNQVICSYTITVEDEQNPVFVNCPNTTFTISTDENCSNEVIWSIPIADDNCGIISVIETSSGGPFYGQPLDPDTYNIQYTATDIYGNTATCNFTIIVEDDNAPLLVCLPDLTVSADAGVCTWNLRQAN